MHVTKGLLEAKSLAVGTFWDYTAVCRVLVETEFIVFFEIINFPWQHDQQVLTSKGCLVAMWQATSLGSKNRITLDIHTPAVPGWAMTLHFLITAICSTLWHKASCNRACWFLVKRVSTKCFKALLLAFGIAWQCDKHTLHQLVEALVYTSAKVFGFWLAPGPFSSLNTEG